MTTPTDSNPNLLTVIAHMKAAPGKEAELRRELEALVEPTSSEDGFVNYNLHVSTEDEGLFYLYENWESEAKLDEHLAAPHLVRFAGMLGDLLDANGLTISRLKRIA
ncbi:putative quinol monooxygenase [Pseudonocardia endophytica]|uniref:Quinol monooxygenase YgiN n=1 Tax=Pseudonocardia endophytica TaxID=401976 RepID=A0A4R1HN17_PSEEN|nr:putative quinol monooxygenase [Pseudonocardia endophytica]TCK22463.1 quinol monooxygenase YgiN [Pseudonocardia endophytica]